MAANRKHRLQVAAMLECKAPSTIANAGIRSYDPARSAGLLLRSQR